MRVRHTGGGAIAARAALTRVLPRRAAILLYPLAISCAPTAEAVVPVAPPPLASINQTQATPPSPPNDAQIATSPAAQRLLLGLAALSAGEQAVRAYVASNFKNPEAEGARSYLEHMLILNAWGRGFAPIQFTEASPTQATARVRNDLTNEINVIKIVVSEADGNQVLSFKSGLGGGRLPGWLPPATEEERLAVIASLLDRLSAADMFSGVVVIARDGVPIFQRAYGFADRERGISNTLTTQFRLGSMNKMFTGFTIGRLVEQGLLSYDDPLSKFLPDFPSAEAAQKIQIKHLLSHTSGLGMYFGAPEMLQTLSDVQSVIDGAPRQPLMFEPGSDFSYSNLGVVVLGRIIELVTGKDYYNYMQRTFFEPLGMRGAGFPDYHNAGPEVARPYEFRLLANGRFEQALVEDPSRRGGPAGDAAASAIDLLRFADAMQAGEVVRPATLELHTTPKPELSSPEYGYTFKTAPNGPTRDIIGHGGDASGTCTEFDIIRDTPSRYTMIILANSSLGSCLPVTRTIFRTLAPVSRPSS